MLRRPLVLATTLLAAAFTARADIQFTGVLVTSVRTLYALKDDPAKPSTWRAVGQEFAGLTLASYDEKTDMLILVKDGTELRLHLKDTAKSRATRFEFTGSITFAHGEKIDVRRVTLALDEETVFPLTDAITCSITPRSRVPPIYAREGKTISYLVKLNKSGDYGWFKRFAVPARPGEPFNLKLDNDGLLSDPKTN